MIREDSQAIQLELFTNRFRAIAAEMGEMLRRTAISTNVKERLDFSCAVLDRDGGLVVNAPHIPVHLGALEGCVRAVSGVLPLGPGDVAVTNHPAFGGSHLPDITVITPVFRETYLVGYVASRAHHAEIGGTRPGSAPPDAKSLDEEGVLIPPRYLVRAGEGKWEAMEELLRKGPYPSRSVADNLADLRAAVAANRLGARSLEALALQHGPETLASYMRALQDLADERMRRVIADLPDNESSAREYLDDGAPLCVRIEKRGRGLSIDFSGSSPRHSGNLNATPAIAAAVVLYVLRTLASERFPEMPLNSGLLRPVELRLPHDSILNPDFTREPLPAVIGGNVETSQRLADTVLKAFGVAACSQGTMNNVLFGNERFGYYETVCGGAGATSRRAGASAVHTHMTNTRMTDPEVLEYRYPIRLERFAIRRGSGGAGKHPGGDGVVREMLFLEPVRLSVLTQHRIEEPYGMEGGGPGQPGKQVIRRANGRIEQLAPVDGCDAGAGDRLILETPGGGGYGRPDQDD